MLPKTRAYVKSYDGQTKWIYFFLIEDDDILEKYNTIWDKVSADIKKNLIANLFTIKSFATKSYGNEATDFHDKEISKAGFNHNCLAANGLIMLLKKRKTVIHKFFKEMQIH